MILAARNSHSKYQDYLDDRKKIKLGEEVIDRKRKRTMIREIEAKREKSIADHNTSLELLNKRIEEATKSVIEV